MDIQQTGLNQGPQNGSSYTYYAFISYKRKDSKWADWLHKSLQSYRLPSKLCKTHRELPKRLSPIFLDKDELMPGFLSDTLKTHISQSKYFISICSRNTQDHPDYIDMELRYFLETHNNDYTKIIPFIVDESQRPEVECFSPLLREVCGKYDLVGVNVTEKGKRRAFLKVVACMHGLLVTEIESADDIRRRRNKLAAALTALAVLCGGIFGANYWWQHVAVHEDYYTSYVWENNAARGVGPIEQEALGDYSRYYHFKTVDGKVQSVTYRNYAGMVVPLDEEMTVFNQNAPEILFTYNGDDLYMAKYYDHDGRLLICHRYSADGTCVTLLQDEDTDMAGYARKDLGDMGPNSDRLYITRYVQELDEAGRITRRFYAYGEDFTHVSDGEGTFGYDLDYDDMGRLTQLSYFKTADGAVPGAVDGVTAIAYDYDQDLHRVQQLRYLDGEGRSVTGSDGWASKEYLWNGRNVRDRFTHFDQNGEPVASEELGVASVWFTYDGGVLTGESYCDESGAPATSAEGYAAANYVANQLGQIVSCRYLDVNGAPTTDEHFGVYGYEQDIISDTEHRTRYVDQDGAPMLTRGGYASVRVTKDEYNYPLRKEFRDEQDQLCTDRYAYETFRYDPDTYNVLEWRFFDEEEQPTIGEFDSAAIIQAYDSRGFTTLMEYRDEQGALCDGDRGYAKFVGTCEYEGTTVTETITYYDANNNPVKNPSLGAVGCEYAYTENGKLAGMFYLDGNGFPVFHEEMGFAGVVYSYDEYGYISIVSYCGEAGQPVMKDGFATMMANHDEHGNTLTRSFFNDRSERIAPPDEGYATALYTYDEENRLIAEDYYGVENDELVLAVNPLKGCASVYYEYDEEGRRSVTSYYGAADGELVPMNNPVAGCHAIGYDYDEAGNLDEISYYAIVDGTLALAVNPVEGCAVQMMFLDDRGELTGVAYLDEEFNYMNHLYKGYSVVNFEFDEKGNLVGGGRWKVEKGELVPFRS